MSIEFMLMDGLDEDDQLLMEAVRYGRDLDTVNQLLLQGSVNVNVKDNQGYSALHYACENNHLEMIQSMIEIGNNADIHIQNDEDGETPLHGACCFGHLEAAKLLIENYGAQVNIRDYFTKTPLHHACMKDNLTLSMFLIEHGANVNARIDDGFPSDGGYTPLHMACEYDGQLEIVKWLIENGGANIQVRDGCGETALFRACEQNKLEVAKFLIENGAKVNAENNDGATALHITCLMGHWKVAELLLSQGANVNIKSGGRYPGTPLHLACERNHPDVVWLLLRHRLCLWLPMMVGDYPRNNGNDSDDGELIIRATRDLDLSRAQELIEQEGVWVNTQGEDGRTSLHWAAEEGHLAILEMLLENGADVSAKDEDGNTPLHFTWENDSLDLAKLLVYYGADPDAKNNDDKTPLHEACEFDELEIVKLLVQKGANPNARDNYGDTPWSCACKEGGLETVKFLIENGNVDIHAKNENGKSPIDLALDHDQTEVAKLLVAYGCADT